MLSIRCHIRQHPKVGTIQVRSVYIITENEEIDNVGC